MPSEAAVLYAKAEGIATVTMNRPEVRNAINAEMLCRLADAWQDVNDDPAVRAAIFTGAGDPAFCPGAGRAPPPPRLPAPPPAAPAPGRPAPPPPPPSSSA